MKRGRTQLSIDLPNGNRICWQCKKEKPLEGFHKHSGATKGYRHECAECRSNYQYQRRLESIALVNPSAIAECERCESLMRKQFEITHCISCRRELGLRVKDLAKRKDWSYRY